MTDIGFWKPHECEHRDRTFWAIYGRNCRCSKSAYKYSNWHLWTFDAHKFIPEIFWGENFLISSRVKKSLKNFIFEVLMKNSGVERKEMELKCFASVGTFLTVLQSTVEMFDVNSCHAFLIRNVIRCDCEMMIAFGVGICQQHSALILAFWNDDICMLDSHLKCLQQFPSIQIFSLMMAWLSKLNFSLQLTIIFENARAEFTFHSLIEFFIRFFHFLSFWWKKSPSKNSKSGERSK